MPVTPKNIERKSKDTDFVSLQRFYDALANDKDFSILQQQFWKLSFDFKASGVTSITKLTEYFPKPTNESGISLMVRSVRMPTLMVPVDDYAIPERDFGSFKVVGTNAGPRIPQAQVYITFLNTEFALLEKLFYAWQKEATSTTYLYTDRPFTKANIKIDFFDQTFSKPIITYTLFDAFPFQIVTLNASRESTSENERQVDFMFDWMKFETNDASFTAQNFDDHRKFLPKNPNTSSLLNSVIQLVK